MVDSMLAMQKKTCDEKQRKKENNDKTQIQKNTHRPSNKIVVNFFIDRIDLRHYCYL